MDRSARVIVTLIICICMISPGLLPAHTEDDDPLMIEPIRLSERVLVLRHGTEYKTQVIAIATEKGIVVVDTTYMPSMARQLREIIEKEFGRDDFVYVINTHYHPDHTFGNAVFPEAKVIAHATTKSSMLKDFSDIQAYREKMKGNLKAREEALETLEPGTPDYAFSRQSAEMFARIVDDLGDNFVLRTPDIEFVGEMNLDMGDLNIHMAQFGTNLHTTNDILIHIVEEGVLMSGDLFAIEWLAEIFPTQSVAEQIELLDKAYRYYSSVKVIIPGHYGNYEPEYFRESSDYYAKLFKIVKDLKEQGKTLDELKEELSISSAFPEVAKYRTDFLGIIDFHIANIETVWNELEGSK